MPKLVVMFPVLIMLIMPWVATLEIENINIIVVDADRSSTSVKLIDKVKASRYFVFQSVSPDYGNALSELEYGRADVILEIPQYFENDIINRTGAKVQISANAVDGTKGAMGGSYLSAIINDFGAELNPNGVKMPISITVQNRYNELLSYRFYMIPALMVVLVILMCGFFPALNIVSEKEIGTIEQINVTPVGKFEFIVAKIIPYWIMGIIVLSLCFLIAWLVYGLVPAGSLVTIYASALLFILAMSGFGLLISNYSSTMQQSMFMMFFFVMIFILMSGLFTPVKSMPEWAQWIAAFIPPRYFVDIMRSVYLKGSDIVGLYPQFIALGGFALVLNVWAVMSYKKRS